MSEADAANVRIEALETRITHQDRVIEDLNTSVTEQWKQIENLIRKIEGMADRLQRVEDDVPSSDAPEPPPPHY